MKFSANLGFLWSELSLPDAIEAAALAGFDAVECHWPYGTPTQDVSAALKRTGLKMLGINTRRGNNEAGENGLTALPDRIPEARDAIDEALEYAQSIGASCVHVMAGNTNAVDAQSVFVENLRYACRKASVLGITVLIEPINQYDSPGYFLNSTQRAIDVIEAVEFENLKLMFDCYHIQLIEGDLCHRIERLLPYIGHIQFASVPDRSAPNDGEVNYEYLFSRILALGYSGPLGAEYKPKGKTEPTLDWLSTFKKV